MARQLRAVPGRAAHLAREGAPGRAASEPALQLHQAGVVPRTRRRGLIRGGAAAAARAREPVPKPGEPPREPGELVPMPGEAGPGEPVKELGDEVPEPGDGVPDGRAPGARASGVGPLPARDSSYAFRHQLSGGEGRRRLVGEQTSFSPAGETRGCQGPPGPSPGPGPPSRLPVDLRATKGSRPSQ